MIIAQETDRDDITAFLEGRGGTAMYPLGYLAQYGLSGGHARALRIWLRRQAGRVTDLIAITEDGYVFPCCPGVSQRDLRAALSDRPIRAVIGEAAEVAAFRHVFDLRTPAELDVVEPVYALDVALLILPDLDGLALRSLAAAPRDLLIAWRAAYCTEIMSCPVAEALRRAADDIDSFLASGHYRVLFDGDRPVAMTGFNAISNAAFQVGNVFTPPRLRGRGYARRAVAHHIAEYAGTGLTQVFLSAANPAAARAYQAIGFRREGTLAIVVYPQPIFPAPHLAPT